MGSSKEGAAMKQGKGREPDEVIEWDSEHPEEMWRLVKAGKQVRIPVTYPEQQPARKE